MAERLQRAPRQSCHQKAPHAKSAAMMPSVRCSKTLSQDTPPCKHHVPPPAAPELTLPAQSCSASGSATSHLSTRVHESANCFAVLGAGPHQPEMLGNETHHQQTPHSSERFTTHPAGAALLISQRWTPAGLMQTHCTGREGLSRLWWCWRLRMGQGCPRSWTHAARWLSFWSGPEDPEEGWWASTEPVHTRRGLRLAPPDIGHQHPLYQVGELSNATMTSTAEPKSTCMGTAYCPFSVQGREWGSDRAVPAEVRSKTCRSISLADTALDGKRARV